jgi:hypothetical protein
MVSLVVWTFFYQAIKTFPPGQERFLLQVFLHILLESLRDDGFIKIQKEPKSAFDTFIKCSMSDTLWTALEEVLIKAADLYPRPGPNQKNVKPSLKIIIDLRQDESGWEDIIDKLRAVIKRLRWKFSVIKLLITDLPDRVSIQLLPPSEVCATYDQERQGMCNQYILDSGIFLSALNYKGLTLF